MKVAVVVGVAFPYDAISTAAIEQAGALCNLREVDDVVLFTQWIERDAPCRTYVLSNPWQLVHHPEFRDADLAIFHWGIFYALFDALTLLGRPGTPTPVIHFHNCTPAELVGPEEREGIERSIRQIQHAIGLGVRLWTYSEFNRRTLVGWGAAEDQIDWVTFPIPAPQPANQRRRSDRLEILVVGRLVPAKGVHVLIDSLELLPGDLLERTFVRVASSSTFSSDAYAIDLRTRVADHANPLVTKSVQFVDSPTHDELMDAFAASHLVVSPSFHEGLCVPVIEGYAAGCRVIGTTAGNLPFIVIPPDPVVPPGDPAALADAIVRVAASPDLDDAEYVARRGALVRSFSASQSRTSLRTALSTVLGVQPPH